MDINVLARAMEEFRRIDPEMQINTMLVFLYVAMHPNCNQKDVEVSLGFSNAAASRNVSYWTDHKKYNVEGQGFIAREEDPQDRRYKVLTLTPEGKAFYNKLRSKHYGATTGQKVAS